MENVILMFGSENKKKLYNEGKLSDWQAEKLNSLGMQYTPLYMQIWEKQYKAAEEFFQETGHLDVPSKYVSKTGRKWLRAWLTKQRAMYKESKLSEEQISKLEKLEIKWQTPYEGNWDLYYNAVESFHRKNGHLRIPSDYVSENGKTYLGKWLTKQKKRGKNGDLSADEIAKLDSLGLVWEKSMQKENTQQHHSEAQYTGK